MANVAESELVGRFVYDDDGEVQPVFNKEHYWIRDDIGEAALTALRGLVRIRRVDPTDSEALLPDNQAEIKTIEGIGDTGYHVNVIEELFDEDNNTPTESDRSATYFIT